jgi:DnaJ-class molecular chaperone
MKQIHIKIENKCPTCNGDGGYLDYFVSVDDEMEMYFICHDCNGTGLLTNKTLENNTKENNKTN